MINALIIEDEPRNAELLVTLVTNYCHDVEVKGQAGTVQAAEALIREHNPQLVFLDIQLAGQTGFEVLDAIPDRDFEVIFTTAHEQYAIQAIRYSGIDYLLKPIGLDDLRKAVKRATDKIQQRQPNQSEADNQTPVEKSDRLVVPTAQGYSMVEVSRIAFFEADGAYTRIHLENGGNLLVSQAIGVYEERLLFPGFVRIHRSFLVNQKFIKEYVRGRGGYVLLKDGRNLTVSVRKKSQLLEALGL